MVNSINCTNPRLCIKSLEQWERLERGLKYTEVATGRTYDYCTHSFMDIADLASNATLIAVSLWYCTNMFPDHAAIEMIFEFNTKFIIVINEGFSDHLYLLGLVVCHQIYANNTHAGAKYLTKRSMQYQSLIGWNFTKSTKKYQDVFQGPIKEINKEYICRKWLLAEVVNGALRLNHDCLWYACTLFSKLADISIDELLANRNVSDTIIRCKQA